MFKSSIDEFHAELNLKRDEIEIAQLELKRNNDLLHARGTVATRPPHTYSGVVDATVENISDYLSMLTQQAYGPAVSATLQANVTSDVWQVRAVFDPPASKPVNISATFPLQLGRPFDRIWTSSITVTIDAPELNLEKIPHRSAAPAPHTGTLTGQITLTDTPRHPRLEGYGQLRNGQVGSRTVDTRIRFGGTTATVESFQLGGPQNGISFFGEINLADTQNLTVRLFPNQPLYDLTIPVLDCFTKIEVASVPAASSAVQIGELQLSGDVARGDWHLTLKELPWNGFAGPAVWDFTSRTFRACPTTSSQAPLVFGVQILPAPSPSPTRARKPRP